MPFVNNIIINKYCLQRSSIFPFHVADVVVLVGKTNRYKSHNNENNSKRLRGRERKRVRRGCEN